MHTRILIAIVVASLCGLSCAQAQDAPKTQPKPLEEPKIQPKPLVPVPMPVAAIAGRTLDDWLADIPSKDRSKTDVAIRSVMLFDAEQAQKAVPVFLKELKKHTITTPIDTTVRVNLIIAVGDILTSVEKPDKKTVSDAVVGIGWMLRDSQTVVKLRAVQALTKFGPESFPAIKELTFTLKDMASWEIRQAAAMAMGVIGLDKANGPNPLLLAALYDRLKFDPASQVRLASIQSLTWLGAPQDKAQLSLLKSNLENVALLDSEPTVRLWAHMAIMSVDGKADPARLTQIAKLLDSKDSPVRVQAAQALAIMAKDAKGQLPRLVQGLDDTDKGVVSWCIMALGRMGTGAEEALPKLESMVKSKETPEVMRRVIQEAVTTIQGKTKAKPLPTPEKSSTP